MNSIAPRRSLFPVAAGEDPYQTLLSETRALHREQRSQREVWLSELALEGRVYELIHRVNSMRKDAGLELTDRVSLTLPAGDGDLLQHTDWIAKETLAVEVEVGAGDAPAINVV